MFDKYSYYYRSVQETDGAIDFMEKVYRKHFKKPLKTLSEDFCGTFALSCDWVKKDRDNRAIGVDLSREPIEYGKKNYLSKLSVTDRSRISLHLKDVRSPKLPKADLIGALNFSYFIFKKRKDLLAYFKNCYLRLSPKGVLVLDCFGGKATQEPCEDKSEFKDFTYYWDQTSFNPITNEGLFYIHFKPKNQKKRLRAFKYDWRMWSIPELRDILEEAGFKTIEVYTEDSNRKGEGNGVFTLKTREEDCDAWIAYITAVRK